MNSNGHNCQPKQFRGDASQNGGFRSKSLFPAQFTQQNILFVSERSDTLNYTMQQILRAAGGRNDLQR